MTDSAWWARASSSALLIVAVVGCASAPAPRPISDVDRGWSAGPRHDEGATLGDAASPPVADGPDGDAVLVEDHGSGRGAPSRRGARARPERPSPGEGLFRNTYYDFPAEGGGPKEATVFDGECRALARVPRDFHDAVCVQGSGRLASGTTISFARRDCPCAAVCPRTGQRICFDALDGGRFPNGRGANGRAITPLRTVAVDTEIIPLGSVLFIPEFVGLPGPGGGRHDGCFVAEDRGIGVVGRQVDVFTGAPATTARINGLLPSNQGVHVKVGDARCAHLSR